MDAEALRAEFPVLRRVAYLNAGTDGPIPQRSVDAARARMQREADLGRGTAGHWAELDELASSMRARLAGLAGAGDDEIALTRSTTDGVDLVLNGLALGPGDEVLTSEEEHPGLLGPLAGMRRRASAEIRFAPLARLAEAVTERTRLVAASHVSWVTGAVAPVAEVRSALDGSPGGGLLLLDGAQAAGAVPLDVRTLGCDFYAASGQKWLCGPNGTGFLFARRDRLEETGIPRPAYPTLEEGSDPMDLVPRPGALRLEAIQHFGPVLAAAHAALDVLGHDGWDPLYRRAGDQAGLLRGLLAERGIAAVPGGPGTLVVFEHPGGPGRAADAVERLARAGVIVRAVPGRAHLRASVGAWTSDGDLERLISAL